MAILTAARVLPLFLTLFVGGAAAQTDRSVYEDGAIVRAVYGPEDDGARMISLKIYSTRADDGGVVDRYGLFDISDPNDIYGRTFSVHDKAQRRVFPLDDRSPGKRNYVFEVTLNPSQGVQFGRPGNEKQIVTTRDKLLALRARHAADHGVALWLGSRKFLVIPQSGSHPGFVFFDGDIAGCLAGGDASCLTPSYFVQTKRKNSSGYWIQEPGPLPIGTIDGVNYVLAFDENARSWSVRVGR